MSAMPTNSGWYFSWVDFHRKATAANADAVAALIVNEDIATGIWEATKEELEECTKRLIRTRRTPKFANEHADAIGTELVVLRSERQRAGFIAATPTGPSDCPNKCFRGILTAPLPQLVRDGKTGRDLARQTCAVLCDVCQCGKAEIVAQDRVEQCAAPEERWKKKKLMTLTQYLVRTGGVDGVYMLREHETRVMLRMKDERGEVFRKDYPKLAATVAGSLRVPYKEHPRGPESINEDS